MHVLVIENCIGTPLGLVRQALADAGAEIDLRLVWRGAAVPASPEGYDGLVVLGGEQSALDDANHPQLPHVAALTRAFGEADKAVLGICLGAQLVARGAGATNILGRPVEFGWHEVRPTAAGRRDLLIAALGEGAPVFHWHLDTFTLPPGAVHLATSAQTEFQAFASAARPTASSSISRPIRCWSSVGARNSPKSFPPVRPTGPIDV